MIKNANEDLHGLFFQQVIDLYPAQDGVRNNYRPKHSAVHSVNYKTEAPYQIYDANLSDVL